MQDLFSTKLKLEDLAAAKGRDKGFLSSSTGGSAGEQGIQRQDNSANKEVVVYETHEEFKPPDSIIVTKPVNLKEKSDEISIDTKENSQPNTPTLPYPNQRATDPITPHNSSLNTEPTPNLPNKLPNTNPSPISPPIQTHSTQAVNKITVANEYSKRPKLWPNKLPKHTYQLKKEDKGPVPPSSGILRSRREDQFWVFSEAHCARKLAQQVTPGVDRTRARPESQLQFLAGGRPCSGTDPTPKPRRGSAPERVDRELTPFPDLKWAWSGSKVHPVVDFRNGVANWKDYGEEMEFSEKDLGKKKNDLGLSKKKKNSVLLCLKKKKIWDLWAIEDLGDWAGVEVWNSKSVL
ncbi:hypothetical protein LWI29_021827 [Acer saccharum]|uniref:Uncharacterized protein n=1 Tax=Acer saccharum TaxID=4024 RepID=A0AA39TDD9_ACESA|nr:hypothetical protein LWI29_021827 [Acer saccharum]